MLVLEEFDEEEDREREEQERLEDLQRIEEVWERGYNYNQGGRGHAANCV